MCVCVWSQAGKEAGAAPEGGRAYAACQWHLQPQALTTQVRPLLDKHFPCGSFPPKTKNTFILLQQRILARTGSNLRAMHQQLKFWQGDVATENRLNSLSHYQVTATWGCLDNDH